MPCARRPVRLEDLAASRARIVTAGDVERRRLERNLHDGAQQRLVTLALSLRLAQGKLDSDPATARTMLAAAAEELVLALEELRELARGLHPAVLTDHGLGAAVEMLAGRAHRSGLRGLADRVEALVGSLVVTSPSGVGTTLRAEIPFLNER